VARGERGDGQCAVELQENGAHAKGVELVFASEGGGAAGRDGGGGWDGEVG